MAERKEHIAALILTMLFGIPFLIKVSLDKNLRKKNSFKNKI